MDDKIKVGDWVQLTGTEWGGYTMGDIYQVQETKDGNVFKAFYLCFFLIIFVFKLKL